MVNLLIRVLFWVIKKQQDGDGAMGGLSTGW